MSKAKSTAQVEYRPISGFPGYRVGDDGTVWTCKNARWGFRDTWKQMKGTPSPSGHLHLNLSGNGKRHLTRIHILVLTAFVGPCPPGMECRHRDGNPANNRLSNLLWGTRKQNMQDRIDHGTIIRGEAHLGAVLTEQIVLEMRKKARNGGFIVDLAKEYGFKKGTVRGAVVGATWKHLPGAVPSMEHNKAYSHYR